MSSEDTKKPYACTTCVQRKVKCDKRHPCLACSRSRLQCQYRSTPPPQRRKRKLENSSQALIERLRSHESILRNAGLQFEPFDDLHGEEDGHDIIGGGENIEKASQVPLPPSPAPVERPRIATQTPHRRRGILVPEYGGKRYYDHAMIAVLGQEYTRDPISSVNQQNLGDSTHYGTGGLQREASDMLASSVLTSPLTQASLQYDHPPASAIMKYWSIFIDNVHPLTKVVHAPTMHQIMVDNTSDTPKNTDALRYSIYACAVASLTDQECHKTFGESQASLIYGFQSGARYMLLESSFLRVPDIDLLRAHVLLLVSRSIYDIYVNSNLYSTSMLHNSDSSSLWIVMGSVIRIAQSQGLHRDGAALGLSPFEIEMRRRLWWYIVTLDGRLSELMGSESALPESMDTLLPSNINDSELKPDMASPPEERKGASEMAFCLLKYHIARFLRDRHPRPDRYELRQSSGMSKQEGKDSISDLESFLEVELLRFCDPLVGVQFLTTTTARFTICKLRQATYHRQARPDPDEAKRVPFKKSNTSLDMAQRIIKYDNLIHSTRSLRGFLWHVNFYFPWGAPIILLKNLTSSLEWDDELEAAWEQIEELYQHHPEYMDTDKVVHLIVGGLTLKAWASREAVLESRGIRSHFTPAFVIALQARQTAFLSRQNDSRTELRIVNEEMNFTVMNDFHNVMGNRIMDPVFEEVDWLNLLGQ